MFSSIGNFAKFLFLFSALFTAAFVLASYTWQVIKRAFGTPLVQIGSFVTSDEERDKNLGSYVLARLKELAAPVRLDALYETNVPLIGDHFGGKDELSFLKDVSITVQGVDLPKAVNAVFAWLPHDQYVASARPEPSTSGSVLHLELLSPTGEPKGWVIRPQHRLLEVDAGSTGEKPPADGNAPVEAASGEKRSSMQLVDRAIYTLVHYMYYDPNAPDHWRMPREEKARKEGKPLLQFPNPRALQAYFSGRQHLISYLQSFNHDDLVEARRQFRLLREEMPHFVQGLMFLGLTLSEMRNEPEAISVYRLAESELRLRPTLSNEEKKTLYQAQLFKAAALRKLYRWEQLHTGLKELDQLERSLDATLEALPPTSGDDRHDFEKLRVSVMTERATSIGYYLILLYFKNFAKALVHPSAPPELASDPALLWRLHGVVRDEPLWDRHQAARDRRDAALFKVLDDILLRQNELLKRARDELNRIETTTLTWDQQKIWASEREKIEGQLKSAEAYALFRYAQARYSSDVDFRERCQQAIDMLRAADAAQPNHYIILQNMGLILGDARYDPTGHSINLARRLFERSIKIKPHDYFGLQHLAALTVRQAYQWDPQFIAPAMITEAIKHAEKARELRPDSSVIPVVLSQLYALQATQPANQAKTQDEMRAMIALAAAEQGEAHVLRIAVARLQSHFLRLRAMDPARAGSELGSAVADAPAPAPGGDPAASGQSAQTKPKDAFAVEKEKLQAELNRVSEVASKLPGWEAKKLLEVVQKLTEQLSQLKVENRHSLRWPN